MRELSDGREDRASQGQIVIPERSKVLAVITPHSLAHESALAT